MPDIVWRTKFVDDAGPIRSSILRRLRYLGLEAHSFECWRSVGGGPVVHKFGRNLRPRSIGSRAMIVRHRNGGFVAQRRDADNWIKTAGSFFIR